MEFTAKINIVDMVMGSGKSSAAINYMNTHTEQRFLYITPLIDEVQRIVDNCRSNKFYTPDEEQFGTKLKGIKYLMSKGYNIASTHALFQYFDQEVIDICRNQGYTLVMDEVADVIEPYNISNYDYNVLMEKFIEVDKNTGLISWRQDVSNYTGEFDEVKRLCEMKCLGCYGNAIMVWLFPIEVFNMFDEIFILTYMFNAQIQRYYYDFFGLEYSNLYVEGDSVDTYHFTTKYTESRSKVDYNSLIHIIDNNKLNHIGDGVYDLSKNWYTRNQDNILMNTLKNNTTNFFRHICNTKSSLNLWTTFKDFKHLISGKGYAKGFEANNCRATNKHRSKTCVAYLINKYLNSVIKQFFLDKNVEVDEDGYALSEMLQFIWRSAIRDGKEITVYIPSSRMRGLLKKWIEDNSFKGE